MTIPNSNAFRHRNRFTRVLIGTGVALLPTLISAAQPQTSGWQSRDPAQQVQAPTAGRHSGQIIRAAAPVNTMSTVQGVDYREIDRYANSLVAGQRVPGLAIAVVRNGKIEFMKGYGITDTSRPEPVDTHTVFRLASLSKSFASALASLLVQQGRIHWNDGVTRWVPSFRLPTQSATDRVTVENLVSQSVGLPKNAFDRDIEANLDYPSAVAKLATVNMKCAPGDCYSYQNVAFSLIGDVVFAATGNFYPEAVERLIFKPLGMNDASYGLGGIQASPRWARPHVGRAGAWRSLTPKPTYYRLAPAAGVNASISDMAQWMIAQTGHRTDVLPENVLDNMHSAKVKSPTELRGSSWRRGRLNDASYGLGWRVYNYAGHRVIFHGGAVEGYRGAMALVPERDLGLVILWNSSSSLPSGLMPTIVDRALNIPGLPWLPKEITGLGEQTVPADLSAPDPEGND